jgi:protoheme IX farnesyltransferase
MKTAVSTLCEQAPPLARPRAADYVELTKPRVAVLVLFTVAAGVLLASGSDIRWLVLLNTVVGTALVAAGASALNQLLERHSDARMRRTENRPLPAGRLQPLEVAVFGTLLGVGGVADLGLLLPSPWAALVAALTFVGYAFVYTPLKPVTPLNTLIGAVPGAMPPVIGWVAARGALDGEAVALFLILFLWQVPHFLAIAWIYREDYARAGLKMLPVVDPRGETTALRMMTYCLTLIPASLLPVMLGRAHAVYLAGAVALGLLFLWTAVRFRRGRTHKAARRVLKMSLIYLPGLLVFWLVDGALVWMLATR